MGDSSNTQVELPLSVFEHPIIANASSGWLRHIPFASWLVAVTRPRCLVELGTHWGDSYFAFCQSAVSNSVPVVAFAVDSWVGDEHAGLYGEEVYTYVSDRNRSHYGGFSTLLRSTFDDAVADFEDGTIDVLHIDGLHTYEAVKRDFENWVPKLSSRGVVLLHDIEVRERGFGVYRLWEELRRTTPGFDFTHGHGLGVLLVGPEAPQALKEIASGGRSGELLETVRRLFEALGERVALRVELGELRTLLAEHLDELASDLEGLGPTSARLLERAALERHALALEKVVADHIQKSSRLSEQLSILQSQNSDLEEVTKMLRDDLSTLGKTIEALGFERSRLEAELADERQSGMRRWAATHSWFDRARLVLPQRWGMLERAMRGRW